jgi:hypothetical protein
MKKDYAEILLSLCFLKAQKNKLELSLSKNKSKRVRERDLDSIQEISRTFFDIVYDNYDSISLLIERITDNNKNAFNIMAPVGSPWYIRKEANLHCYRCCGGRIEVVFDSYIGHLNLWSDPCGMDNLKILLNNFHEVAA